MFKAMNEKELMTVTGGFYYVPMYKGGKVVGTTQVSNWSGISYYKWENGGWVAH